VLEFLTVAWRAQFMSFPSKYKRFIDAGGESQEIFHVEAFPAACVFQP